MDARFGYASIHVHSVYLPPPKLEFNYDTQDWIQKEVDEVKSRAEILFNEEQNVLQKISEKISGSRSLDGGSKAPDRRINIEELELMLQKVKEEFKESFQKAVYKEGRAGQPSIDILEINKLRRQILFHSYVWDQRLIGHASGLTNNNHQEYSPVYVLSFRELEKLSGARLLLPVGVNDTVVPVYDGEPTSVIAYALVSSDYHAQMSELERAKDASDTAVTLSLFESVSLLSLGSFDETLSDPFRSSGSGEESIFSKSASRTSQGADPLLYTKDLHARISFTDDGPLGKVKYTVTCYYAKRFESLRKTCCPSELDFIRSLSRCKKWGAQGGKSNVFFAKTLDDRFIIKQVTKTELESFLKFGPDYFKYLSESINTGCPTCLAKILGIYQVSFKHLKGGKESKIDVLVMENLLFRRNVTRLCDLKGSSRSQYNPDTSGSNKVLLDQNLIEAMPTSPIFVGSKAKQLLERAVWNDTSFLASVDVMDYSLLVGVDEEKQELVLGIIDFMQQYTWDKHLETWVKTSGILGGDRNTPPTVISPQQYKKRFRKAMTEYFTIKE